MIKTENIVMWLDNLGSMQANYKVSRKYDRNKTEADIWIKRKMFWSIDAVWFFPQAVTVGKKRNAYIVETDTGNIQIT